MTGYDVAVFRPITARHENLLINGWVAFGVINQQH